MARPEEGTSETLEGSTREEVQQKIDDKLTALVGDTLHNEKLAELVQEVLHNRIKIGGVEVKVNVTTKPSTGAVSQPALPAAADLGINRSSETRFESSSKLWIVIAVLVAIGAIVMYLLKR